MTAVPDPIVLFQEWIAQAAARSEILEPDAAALATVDSAGHPSVRMVLVRSADERGFVFYTNLESRKGRELLAGASGQGAPAALAFWWPVLLRQVRVEGRAMPVSGAEADAYWATRARDSQVGARASRQSAELRGGREELTKKFDDLSRSLPEPVPRPENWSGFRIEPACSTRAKDADGRPRS